MTCGSEDNLGCDRRIASGLDWVFGHTDRAIILEDDCLPDPSFFPYCQELLERYQSDPRVHMVSGFNATGLHTAYSYHFSRCYHIWGWATWARAWQHYGEEMRSWPRLRQERWLDAELEDAKGARLTEMYFEEAYSGRMPQWDFYWAFSSLERGAVSVTPEVNLVRNIGHGPEATHQRDPSDPLAHVPQGSLSFPLRHPPEVEVFAPADRVAWASAYDRLPRGEKRGPWRSLVGAAQRGVGALGRRGATRGASGEAG